MPTTRAVVQLSTADIEIVQKEGTERIRITGHAAFVTWVLSCALAQADASDYSVICTSATNVLSTCHLVAEAIE
jgi:hypothetical protein